MEFVFESAPDPEIAADLAQRAFGRIDPLLDARRFSWTYGRDRDDVIVLAAMKDGQKVGQGVFMLQKAVLSGRPALAAQFVDLFVDQGQRGGPIVMGLYKRLLERARQSGVDLIFATPNAAARELNRKLMGLMDSAELTYRTGIAIPFAGSGTIRSHQAGSEPANRLLEEFTETGTTTGMRWNAEDLARRLGHPHFRYSLHASDEALLVASPRKVSGLSFVLATAFLVRREQMLSRRAIVKLLGAAARHHRLPLFVYAGLNNQLERPPGVPVPARWRAPVLVQSRLVEHPSQPPSFDRLELLDFDFA